jgi:hypothetical protein
MITLKDYLEAVNYKITGGSEYQWKCFGDNARYLDCESEVLNEFSVHCVFDSVNQTVYSIEAWDYDNERVYRWIHPAYIKKHMKACAKHNVDVYSACDTMNYTDLDVAADILEKTKAIVLQEPYDERVQIEVDFTDEDMLKYMKLAHDMDITFNELVERALREAIDAHNATKENDCED